MNYKIAVTKNLTKKYRAFSVHNFRKIPQIERLSEEEKRDIEIASQVLPFKVNNYVVDELINWDDYKEDPMFHLTFPQKGMLKEKDFSKMADAMENGMNRMQLRGVANKIRNTLNPH